MATLQQSKTREQQEAETLKELPTRMLHDAGNWGLRSEFVVNGREYKLLDGVASPEVRRRRQ